MKKYLITLAVIVLAFVVVGVNQISLNNKVNDLEQQVYDLNEELDGLQYIEGLNGQREYYSTTALAYEPILYSIGETIDTSIAPSYVLDDSGNYVTFEDLALLLTDKYFPEKDFLFVSAEIGSQVSIKYGVTYTMSVEEYMARVIFLIEELSNYDFYIIGSSELTINILFEGGANSCLKVPVQTLRSSFITLTPECYYNQWYEILFYGIGNGLDVTFDTELTATYYNDFDTSGVFDGYVLNYTE